MQNNAHDEPAREINRACACVDGVGGTRGCLLHQECGACGGHGWDGARCSTCRGTGRVPRVRECVHCGNAGSRGRLMDGDPVLCADHDACHGKPKWTADELVPISSMEADRLLVARLATIRDPRTLLAYARCTRCPGMASIYDEDDTHEARCPCGWTFVEISTGGDR